MRTLKLFNAVVAKKPATKSAKPIVSTAGYVIEPAASWAKDAILAFYAKEALDGRDLNKTFHKSWATIKNTTREDLLLEQIQHYLSTYGTGFEGEIYIPDEVLKVPKLKLAFKVIRGLTEADMTAKALSMLQSGIALSAETVDDLLHVLAVELDYKFTGDEGIRNKEAIVKIADLYGVLPKDFMGFFRYILFRATGDTLVIKNGKTIAAVKAGTFNPDLHFRQYGLEKLAANFNRFKPLFLAFKGKCPATINEISRLSKTAHKPMPTNALSEVTARPLGKADLHWLDNATPYALFKALAAVHARMNGQSVFMYRVRNGKSFVKEGTGNFVAANYKFLTSYIAKRISLKGLRIYTPEDVTYAVPTSEKMYVGNIPMGTKFYGDKLAVGIYWENAGGAYDLDLSGMSAAGKTGWNAAYGRGGYENDGIMFSGDITSAPSGAVEYLYAQKGIPGPTLVLNNVFNGKDDAAFSIIVGRGAGIDQKFMMDPNKLFCQANVKSVQKQSVIGLLLPEANKRVSFVLLNFGAGHTQVSGHTEHSVLARVALAQQWRAALSFNELATALGATFVDKPADADVDLSLSKLEKDSFTRIFDGLVKPAKKTAKRPVAA